MNWESVCLIDIGGMYGGSGGGRRGGFRGAQTPPVAGTKGPFVKGGTYYSMHFTLGHQISIVAAVIIGLNLW